MHLQMFTTHGSCRSARNLDIGGASYLCQRMQPVVQPQCVSCQRQAQNTSSWHCLASRTWDSSNFKLNRNSRNTSNLILLRQLMHSVQKHLHPPSLRSPVPKDPAARLTRRSSPLAEAPGCDCRGPALGPWLRQRESFRLRFLNPLAQKLGVAQKHPVQVSREK